MDRFCKTTAYYMTLCLTQIVIYFTITYGKSIRIDIRTDPSIYPCLDTFDILMTTPNITDEMYVRLIRVYTSNHMQRYYTNTLKLEYVREYRLPLNNYLKIDCHVFDADFRYYCFVFVALSQTTGAVLINGRPHCRPTTVEMIDTSTPAVGALLEDNTINPIVNERLLEQLRPAGPSYKYNYPTKANDNNIYGKSRRVGAGDGGALNDNRLDDSYFDQYSDEGIAHYIGINCRCSDSYRIESNVSTVIISLDWNSSSDYDLIDRNHMKNSYLSNSESADSGLLSTICILNLTEKYYNMRVQYEVWRNSPVIYVQSSHIPELVVREGRLSIDPQLDINNKSQIHSLKSNFIRIESFYSQNLTLKLILIKSNNVFIEKNSFLSTLTPIHYTSLALFAVFGLCLFILVLISLFSPQRKIIVKIVTPSEEGDQTHTSCVEGTDILSHFSLADDNQSLEMDYYDYTLPFVSRPQSRSKSRSSDAHSRSRSRSSVDQSKVITTTAEINAEMKS